jgi:hypothetical protein
MLANTVPDLAAPPGGDAFENALGEFAAGDVHPAS